MESSVISWKFRLLRRFNLLILSGEEVCKMIANRALSQVLEIWVKEWNGPPRSFLSRSSTFCERMTSVHDDHEAPWRSLMTGQKHVAFVFNERFIDSVRCADVMVLCSRDAWIGVVTLAVLRWYVPPLLFRDRLIVSIHTPISSQALQKESSTNSSELRTRAPVI